MAYMGVSIPSKQIRKSLSRKALLDSENAYRNITSLRPTDTTLNQVDADSAAKRLQRGGKLGQEDRINALRGRLKIEDKFDTKSKESSWLRPVDPVASFETLATQPHNARVGGMLEFRRGQNINKEVGYLTAMENANRQKAADIIGQNYTNAAKRAGTFADTAQFKAGLDDEIGYGVQGANLMADQRLATLRKFRPDDGITADTIPTNGGKFGIWSNQPKRRLAQLQKSYAQGEAEYAKEQAKLASQAPSTTVSPEAVSTGTSQADTTTPTAKATSDVPKPETLAEPDAATTMVSGTPTLTNKRRTSAISKKRGVTI